MCENGHPGPLGEESVVGEPAPGRMEVKRRLQASRED